MFCRGNVAMLQHIQHYNKWFKAVIEVHIFQKVHTASNTYYLSITWSELHLIGYTFLCLVIIHVYIIYFCSKLKFFLHQFLGVLINEKCNIYFSLLKNFQRKLEISTKAHLFSSLWVFCILLLLKYFANEIISKSAELFLT